ncbi:MAG: hypothetical protein UW68_C0026G0005 [Candidatus Collierbacteria bacterium GW2011_GWB1_44_6]|uniref:Uncharacterized protein n=1 Tax=Candidatus Collierbacteria bacterium GW2011_GWB1_44_6 TaxID=1618384 RepID=A0A0G1JMH7_9BACT|nr:MAG: hypothetical protein UW68_C0026G0005 [Candidatus Collierbacteria bacterium GW2011_GWB1_44_6]
MITVKINSVDCSSSIIWPSLSVEQNLTSQVDNASFQVRKYGTRLLTPEVSDLIEIYDGADLVFSGQIINITEDIESNAGALLFTVQCVDHTYELDGILVAETYENMTVKQIIDDIVANYAPTFTAVNVNSTYLISKIVFNQISISQCLKRLADLLKYEWYVDEVKDIHFFTKFTNVAPYNLTDTSGNFIYDSLSRKVDGTQIANQVKVRGGLGTETSLFTDVTTVKGNNTLSFKLPYKYKGLVIRVDTGSGYVGKQVGIEFIDKFVSEGGTADVLYNYQDDSIRFPSVFADGNKIEFSGYRKYPVMAVASDSASIDLYGLREKLIKDNSIEDNTIARKRATAELQVYKDEISDGRFDTYTKGLRAGMVIQLDSTLRNVTTDFLIKKLKMKPIDPSTFMYSIELITTRKYTLIDLLQKLLQTEDYKIDEHEVAEIIKTDLAEVTIEELIEVVHAVADVVAITIVENIQKDPIGAHVEPIWVLADYFPTGPTDPKRTGRLDLSFELY